MLVLVVPLLCASKSVNYILDADGDAFFPDLVPGAGHESPADSVISSVSTSPTYIWRKDGRFTLTS